LLSNGSAEKREDDNNIADSPENSFHVVIPRNKLS
jgi:hypothetical protein